MNDIENQRHIALIERAHRNVMNATRKIVVSRSVLARDVVLEVEAKPDEQNLSQINHAFEIIDRISPQLEDGITGCERLCNLIYVSIAEKFSDSQITISVKMGNVGVTVDFNFNIQSTFKK